MDLGRGVREVAKTRTRLSGRTAATGFLNLSTSYIWGPRILSHVGMHCPTFTPSMPETQSHDSGEYLRTLTGDPYGGHICSQLRTA